MDLGHHELAFHVRQPSPLVPARASQPPIADTGTPSRVRLAEPLGNGSPRKIRQIVLDLSWRETAVQLDYFRNGFMDHRTDFHDQPTART